MVSVPRAFAALAVATVLTTSCTRYVDDARAVAADERSSPGTSDASLCETVDAPLTTIPAKDDREPVMKIPQPKGWVRTTMLDSELIRFAMANRNLVKDGFASNAVVTFESARGIEDPDVVFDGEREALEKTVGATDLRVTDHKLCGLSAQTVHFQIPTMGNLAAHPGMAVYAVIHSDDTTYAAGVTIQSTDPDDPTYQRESDMILTGFQLLPPTQS